MGRISSALLLEALVVGGRLSLPEGPGTRQSQDTQPRGGDKRMAALGDSQGRSALTACLHLLGREAGSFHQGRATVLTMKQK